MTREWGGTYKDTVTLSIALIGPRAATGQRQIGPPTHREMPDFNLISRRSKTRPWIFDPLIKSPAEPLRIDTHRDASSREIATSD